MSIEKMTLVHLDGERESLDYVLMKCLASGIFHPEPAASLKEYSRAKPALEEANPYRELLGQIRKVADLAGIQLNYTEADTLLMRETVMNEYLSSEQKRLLELSQEKNKLDASIEEHRDALVHLKHMLDLRVDFDELFSCRYLKIRFGRMPAESVPKLSFYEDKPFLFLRFDEDDTYLWCAYLTSSQYEEEIDEIFLSLYFERMRVPDYAHGTPQRSREMIEGLIAQEQAQRQELIRGMQQIIRQEEGELSPMYSKIRFRYDAYELRRYAVVTSNRFHLVGFIPKRQEKEFGALFEPLEQVEITYSPPERDKRLTPPAKLRNNWLVRPFEMFVTMYGLPSYYDIDPTTFVAFTYTLIFGMMFGDVGQGLVISLLGFVLYRWKKMELGRVMERLGVSSAVFGCVYGSVFGFEHLLDPVYQALFGLSEKPIDVMAPDTTNLILIVAVALGMFIIIASIIFNIVLGLKRHDLGRALFSNNGLAGLVFYGSVIVLAAGMLLLNVNVLNPVFLILFIVLPLLVMFLKEPLTRLVQRKKKVFEEGVGNFFLEGFFEFFEVLLSFVTNTMSFLRVGGFILSHAGMMAVVFTLSSMIGGAGSPVVLIIGNLFVMAMEGLIVGIQVLRLEFYEMFSRFFDGDGKAYVPSRVETQALHQ